jgi:hypothetical protein
MGKGEGEEVEALSAQQKHTAFLIGKAAYSLNSV